MFFIDAKERVSSIGGRSLYGLFDGDAQRVAHYQVHLVPRYGQPDRHHHKQ